ncbi:MAG: PAS domain-containing sensor histidine kinase [Gemmatimonadota bacterium]
MSAAFDSTLVDILFQTSAAGVALVDREFRYVRVNEALARMNQWPAEQHAGRHVRDVLPAAGVELLVGLLTNVLQTGVPVVDAAFTDSTLADAPRHFLANYYPVREADGVVSGVAAVVFEQTPAEHALRASESRLRRVSESGIVGLFLWSIDGGILEANDAFLSMLGYTQDDLARGLVDWRRMTPPEYAALDERAVQDLFEHGFHGQVAKEYIGKGGRRVPVTITSAMLDGSRDHGVCVCLDDSARRRAESEEARLLAAEREESALRAALLEAMSDAFAAFDTGLRYTYVNRQAEALLGYSSAELLGREVWDVFPEARDGPSYDSAITAMREQRRVEYEFFLSPIDRWIRAANYPIPGGVAAIFRDVTTERERNQEREQILAAERQARAEAEAARADAEAANRAKSEFLAVMSHELRTPLNAIGGYAELIELGIRGPVTAQQREDLLRIQKSQRHLLSLINEVLNYTRLESGAVSYDLTPVRVAEAVVAAEMLIMPQLRAKGLRFSSSHCDRDIVVLADREKLQQILLNLLSNSIKFTGVRDGWPGLVEVRCGAGPSEHWVHIEVADTGSGIPADKVDAVFEPFVQVDSGLVRPNGGTGLGLAISRDLARGMGGDLTLSSVVGAGSVFTIALPRFSESWSPAAPVSRAPLGVPRTS